MKVVAFFNHKGGVGKTTIVFNTAIALGELGHKVAIVDADAQANASAIALGEEHYETAVNKNETLWTAVAPLVSGAGDFRAVAPIELRENVCIVPGDIRLSKFEAILPQSWTEALAGNERGFRATTALHRLCQSMDELCSAEYVFVDVGPNVGALNRSVLIACDGFVVPLAPDLFSILALPSVGTSIAEWKRQWETARENKPEGLNFGMPNGDTRPLGYVTQQFSTYRKEVAAAYMQWLGRVPDTYAEGVEKPLGWKVSTDAEIAQIPNLYSLIPLAQETNKAIFELSGREARGAHWTKAQTARVLFRGLATKIIARVK